MERALEITLGREKQPAIREDVHVLRDPAVSQRPFCRFVAEWKA